MPPTEMVVFGMLSVALLSKFCIKSTGLRDTGCSMLDRKKRIPCPPWRDSFSIDVCPRHPGLGQGRFPLPVGYHARNPGLGLGFDQHPETSIQYLFIFCI